MMVERPHASPRLHSRRGHYRTCASGKRVWVRECKVGDPVRGQVAKDYRVVGQEGASRPTTVH